MQCVPKIVEVFLENFIPDRVHVPPLAKCFDQRFEFGASRHTINLFAHVPHDLVRCSALVESVEVRLLFRDVALPGLRSVKPPRPCFVRRCHNCVLVRRRGLRGHRRRGPNDVIDHDVAWFLEQSGFVGVVTHEGTIHVWRKSRLDDVDDGAVGATIFGALACVPVVRSGRVGLQVEGFLEWHRRRIVDRWRGVESVNVASVVIVQVA
mmetsp:Transcript_21318/g.50083  ORF Transcript_21318/g.50083 Transcript_21318/m.50083 type:complete len:208 (+) Transcript_21318:428-1051(+)